MIHKPIYSIAKIDYVRFFFPFTVIFSKSKLSEYSKNLFLLRKYMSKFSIDPESPKHNFDRYFNIVVKRDFNNRQLVQQNFFNRDYMIPFTGSRIPLITNREELHANSRILERKRFIDIRYRTVRKCAFCSDFFTTNLELYVTKCLCPRCIEDNQKYIFYFHPDIKHTYKKEIRKMKKLKIIGIDFDNEQKNNLYYNSMIELADLAKQRQYIMFKKLILRKTKYNKNTIKSFDKKWNS